MHETLRGRNGQMLGTLREESGMIVLRDKHNNKLGYYNPRTNDTRDGNGRLLGRGNLLATLLND